jgi:hypothetical protein
VPERAETTTTIAYAERWSSRRGGVVRPLDREEARRRHESGQLYVAVIAGEERVLAYLEVRLEAGFVGVHVVDERLRDGLVYLFARNPDSDDDLFLEQVQRNEYVDSGDELARSETYLFSKDGSVKVEKADFATREVERYELRADVSSNWEPVPEFGRYESITRVERD